MAYPDTYYRQRQTSGEMIAGKNLHGEVQEEEHNAAVNRSQRIVYGVVAVMMGLVLTRIIIRLAALDTTVVGSIVDNLTDPYVWIFNSLFYSNPRLLLSSIEPGSLVSLVFFPLVGWAIQGLVHEANSGKFHFSRSKFRRQ